MWYLATLALLIAIAGAWFFFKKASPNGALDVNKDGKVDSNDIKVVADVNKDGKVDTNDARVAVAEVVTEVNKAIIEIPVAPEKPKKTAAKKTTKKASK